MLVETYSMYAEEVLTFKTLKGFKKQLHVRSIITNRNKISDVQQDARIQFSKTAVNVVSAYSQS
jgi:hypothetical protein